MSRFAAFWDPIGVKDVDPKWPSDEYDCCMGPIFHLLTEGASDDQIADFLWSEITGHFGLLDPASPRTVEREASLRGTVAALREIPIPRGSN